MNLIRLSALLLIAIAGFAMFDGWMILQQQPENIGLTNFWENEVSVMLLSSFAVFVLALVIYWKGGKKKK